MDKPIRPRKGWIVTTGGVPCREVMWEFAAERWFMLAAPCELPPSDPRVFHGKHATRDARRLVARSQRVISAVRSKTALHEQWVCKLFPKVREALAIGAKGYELRPVKIVFEEQYGLPRIVEGLS